MKRVICFLTVCFMMIGMTSVFALGNADSFVDVTEEHFAYDAVQYFYQANVLEGVGDNMFAPDAFVTREQFAKMLSIIYGKENDAARSETFSDVTSDMWSYAYIESVKEYLTGYYPAGGKAFFNPYGKATREDVAYALVKISGLKETTSVNMTVLNQYEDSAQISVNLKEYVAIAVDAGLMQGYEDRLRPQDGITRAEVATLLFRAIKKPVEVEKPEVTEPEKKEEDVKGEEIYQVETNSILQISGYREEDIDGTLFLEWSPEAESATFYADLKCKNSAFDIVDCNISLTEVVSVSKNRVVGYFDVLTHGKYRHENIKGTILVQGDTLTLNTEEYDYNLVASLTAKAPKPSEEKKDDEVTEEYLWEDASSIFCEIKSVGEEKASGYFKYDYNDAKNISKVESSFTVGENEYSIVLTKEISKLEGNVEGYFSVFCNNVLITENALGNIVNYNANIGEMIEFVLEDRSICITMQIVEIVK